MLYITWIARLFVARGTKKYRFVTWEVGIMLYCQAPGADCGLSSEQGHIQQSNR